MMKQLHLIFLKVTIAGFFLPAIFFSEGRWARKLFQDKLFFKDIIAEYPTILSQLAHSNNVKRALVKSSLSIAIVLYKTRSFTKAARHVFKVLSGAPAFAETTPTYTHTSPENMSESSLYRDYIDFFTERSVQEESMDFVPLATSTHHDFDLVDIKLIAFYLPQFHAFPLNDDWYGKGFTEWTNVTKAIPQYTGHYQPQLPIDMGYYDLNDMSVMRRQVELAKMYGIHAFCFHYYWFSGTRLMEKPIFNWLEHQDMDFPFCLNWANENWSKLWDGGNREVRYKQELLPGDDEKFFEDILPFLRDRRYITLRGKPLLLIYRPHLFPQERFLQFVQTVRKNL
jgi:hypothetical protein